MSPIAYLIKSWREIRLVIFIALALISIFSNFFVQESLRWLLSMSRLRECTKIIDKIAKFNRLSVAKSDSSQEIKEHSAKSHRFEVRRKKLNQMFIELEKFNKINAENNVNNSKGGGSSSNSTTLTHSIFEMFKNSKFRLYVLIMALNWFATALVYDGLTYLNNFIGENIFVNWIAMNLIELPAQFVCYYLISRYGRRITVSLTLILAGVTLLATPLVEIYENRVTPTTTADSDTSKVGTAAPGLLIFFN